MRRILLLAVITLMAILPLCAQNNKLAELRRMLTEHYAGDAEKQQAVEYLISNIDQAFVWWRKERIFTYKSGEVRWW